MSLRTFNDSEMRIIREVIDRVRSSSTSSPAQFYSVQTISQSEECFVALPQDTVPGLSRAGGTGTGTGTGTVTSEESEPSDDDEPGWAYCDIYRIQPNGALYSGAGTSADPPPDFALVHKDQLVFNLSTAELDKEWTVVCKTKFGQWVFVGGVAAEKTYFVKPDQDVTQGILSAPDNKFSKWKGPAHSDDAATGEKIDGDYATQDFVMADYCIATEVRGMTYISCFQPSTGTGSV